MRSALAALQGRLAASVGRPETAPGTSAPGVPAPLSSAEFEMVQVDAGRLWISRRDEVMRPYMARAGTWEPEEGQMLRALVRPGCRFLDIGANVGYFSALVHGMAPGVTVDAVEPDPTNVHALRFNLWVNGVASTIWPLALDDRERALHLTGAQQNLGDLRTGRVGDGVPSGDAGWIVPAERGDHLFAGRIFDVVKIDTQGWELEILLGIDGVLRGSPGVRVVAEFWPGALRQRGRQPTEVLGRYLEMGYDVRAVIHGEAAEMSPGEIVQVCDSGGPDGQVNLLLSR